MVQHALKATPPRVKTILVCDDEPHIVRLIQVGLERAGHRVIPCYDGKAALQYVQDEHPDVVVLDLMLPGISGLQVLKRLRANPQTEKIRVVIVSVRSDDTDVFEAYHFGADSYLTKPFNPMELLKIVDKEPA